MTARMGGARRLLVAAALVAAAAVPALDPVLTGPAEAAACSAGSGVTVVVDYHQLGGGVVQKCDAAGAGKSAQSLFADNGFSLAYVQRQPGFVCRVNGKPDADAEACVNTPPADAYWGLFWADGKSASWKYSTLGVAGLTLQDGQSVAFSWQASTTSNPPGAKPPATSSTSPTPKPSASPKPSTSATPSAGGATNAASPTPTAVASSETSDSPTATRSAKPSRTPKASTSAAATAGPTTASVSPVAAPVSEPPSSGGGDGGLPVWALPGLVAAMVAVGAVTALLRRRAGGSSS